MKIRNKREWYKIQAMEVFNTTQNFSVTDFLKRAHEFPSTKMFCARTKVAGGGFFRCFTNEKMVRFLTHLPAHWDPSWIQISEQAPDDAIVVQGEYNGEWARVTFEKTPMRFALQKSSAEISRVQLLGLIGPHHYRVLEKILEDFNPTMDLSQNPVIEFSVYSRPVGMFNEAMIIWEVRNY